MEKENPDCGSDRTKCKRKPTPGDSKTIKTNKALSKHHANHGGKVQYNSGVIYLADFLVLGFASLAFLRAPTAANASSDGSSIGPRFLPLGWPYFSSS